MSRTALGVLVSTGFAIALTFTAIPDGWKPTIVTVAWSVTGLAAIAWYRVGRSEGPNKPGRRPLFLAIDQLKVLLREGKTMEFRFEQVGVKPTFGKVVEWNERVLACAQQSALEPKIDTPDITRLRTPWNDAECRKAEAVLDQYHRLDGMNETGRSVYRYLFGSVKRLEELLSNIEGGTSWEPQPAQTLVAPIIDSPTWLDHIERKVIGYSEENLEQERLREGASKKVRQEILEKAADLLNETPRQFVAEFNALPLAGAHRLESNRDLVWICNKLSDGGHQNTLLELGDWVPQRDWLEFLQWVTVRANTNTKNGYNYVWAAAEWPKRKGYAEPSKPIPMVLRVLAHEVFPQ